jgi:transcriptional regulator with XRE-family HTH domain
MFNLGKRVKQIREEKGMTQGDVATKLNITRSYISRVEKGERAPSVPRLEKLATALDVSVEELFYNEPFDDKWNKVIEAFEGKNIEPEEILGLLEVVENLFNKKSK